jgi:UDP-N-acetylglucosamine--dolichyl-phosphate N-acetylglucosaminephosphotransferase
VLPAFTAALSLLLGFLAVERLTEPWARLMLRKGICGRDVHKPDRPLIPEMGGVTIVVGLAVGMGFFTALNPEFSLTAAAFLSTVVVAAVVGVVDDWLRPLSPLEKVAAVTLAALPLLILGMYTPYPVLPFVGGLRLTLIYPFIFMPLLVTVLANSVNMLDVLNGSMAGTSTISALFLTLIAVLFSQWETAFLLGLLAACTYGFYRHNRYPAEVFPGDGGSLAVGAAFAAAAIIGRLEVLTLIVLLPALINGSLILSSLGRLVERRGIKERPTLLVAGPRIAASPSRQAPVTLTRLMVASQPLREEEVVRGFMALNLLTGALALATALFMLGG